MIMFEFVKKIVISLLLSALIGTEREYQDKPAGLRTIMFVCLGATLSMLFALELGKIIGVPITDIVRIPGHYLAAIGFVGTGSIIMLNKHVEGITTAALLLPITIVGFFCGLGNYPLAVISTLSIYLILVIKTIQVAIQNRKAKKNGEVK